MSYDDWKTATPPEYSEDDSLGASPNEVIDSLRDELDEAVCALAAFKRERDARLDRLAMIESALDDWDWAGLARDANSDDVNSGFRDALETIARVDAARKAGK